MPGKKTGRKARGGAGDSAVIPFHTVLPNSLSAGAFGIILSPNATISPRALAEADAWAHFRILRFMMRLHPPTTTAHGTQVVGVVGGVQDLTPSTVSAVGELIPSAVLGASATVPTEWVHVSRLDLAGPFPWYKTIPGLADSTEESPGALVVAGTGTDSFVLEIRGVFEFKTAVSTGNTPMAVAAMQQLRMERYRSALTSERALLIKILGGTPGQQT